MRNLVRDQESLSVQASGAEKFVAREKFRRRESIDGIFFAQIGPVFKKCLRPKIEEGVPDLKLSAFDLQEDPYYSQVVARLGDKETIAVSLAHISSVLKKQERQGGILLVSSKGTNIFYVRDDNDIFWTVSVYWDSAVSGWRLNALLRSCPGWIEKYRVFYRDS